MVVKDLEIGTRFQTRNNRGNIYTVISGVRNIDGIEGIEGIMIKVEDSNGNVYDKEIFPYIIVDKVLK